VGGALPRNKGTAEVDHLTTNGTIRIGRRVYWYRSAGVDNRLDCWLGIADASVSVGARELCCLVAVDCSFAKAAAKLKRLGQIDVGLSRLRELVEREGRQVLDVRRRGLLSPSWTGELLHLAKHEGPLAVLKEIAATREMAALACVEQSNTLNGYWSLQRQGVA